MRHKGKSLAVGFILFLGALLMTVGNGVIAGMDKGIECNIVNGFLGDIVIISDKQKTDNILFDFTGASIETITNYKHIKEILNNQHYIEKHLPAGKNFAVALSEYGNSPGVAYLLGVDFEEYRKMFPDNFLPIEGRLLNRGERGILIPVSAREEYYSYTNIWVIPEGGRLVPDTLSEDAKKDMYSLIVDSNIVLMGMNEANSSNDVRFSIKGIIKYRSLNTIFGHFALTDIESYRDCLGYLSAADRAGDISPEEKELLESGNTDIDDMFSGEGIAEQRRGPSPQNRAVAAVPKKPLEMDIESGAYNMVFVKLKPGIAQSKALKVLNSALKESGTRAVSWQRASGVIGNMAMIIKGALFLFVMLLFIVAIIIIINTLTMTALERMPEIGMMRAIGAGKGFIGAMFFGETGILSAIFGGAGIAAGVIIVNIIPLMHIKTDNDMLQLLYGGDIFHPVLSVPDIFVTVAQLTLVTLIASAYPVRVAKRITPLDAVSRD